MRENRRIVNRRRRFATFLFLLILFLLSLSLPPFALILPFLIPGIWFSGGEGRKEGGKEGGREGGRAGGRILGRRPWEFSRNSPRDSFEDSPDVECCVGGRSLATDIKTTGNLGCCWWFQFKCALIYSNMQMCSMLSLHCLHFPSTISFQSHINSNKKISMLTDLFVRWLPGRPAGSIRPEES